MVVLLGVINTLKEIHHLSLFHLSVYLWIYFSPRSHQLSKNSSIILYTGNFLRSRGSQHLFLFFSIMFSQCNFNYTISPLPAPPRSKDQDKQHTHKWSPFCVGYYSWTSGLYWSVVDIPSDTLSKKSNVLVSVSIVPIETPLPKNKLGGKDFLGLHFLLHL